MGYDEPMPVDSSLFELSKPIEDFAEWPRPLCPVCDSGHIGFSEPSTCEDPKMLAALDNPEGFSGMFEVRGACENPRCKQIVVGVGDYTVDIALRFDPLRRDDSPVFANFYSVRFFNPSISIMSVPARAPEAVRDGILRASRVLFTDPGLAATALRTAVEGFLTSEGIPAVRAPNKIVSLAKRLEDWKKVDDTAKTDDTGVTVYDLFTSVRWIGNAGTHEGSDLTVADVLEGAGLLHEAFHKLFTASDIEKSARSINEAKGPVRK